MKKFCVQMLISLFLVYVSVAQESRTEIHVDFRVGKAIVESDYGNNAKQLFDAVAFLQSVRKGTTHTIKRVSFCGATSPEGSLELNKRLAHNRLTAPECTIRPDPSDSTPSGEKTRNPRLHLKTNLAGWGLLIANIGIEVDLAKHWSFALPIYYSGTDYFTSATKFRTFGIQPEIRCWFSGNDGWFIGGHFGLAYYNFALNGDWRIQDHNGTTPALGGGLSIGYRVPIGKSRRWKMEFSIGGGAYELHYDKFQNNKNGQLAETIRKTYIGIDNVALSFSYMFDLKNPKKQ